jgi:hypothetical protein
MHNVNWNFISGGVSFVCYVKYKFNPHVILIKGNGEVPVLNSCHQDMFGGVEV